MAGERILIVDDEESVRVLLSEAIKRKTDYVPVVAKDGEEAYEIACREPINVVLTDLLMPRLSGEALLAKLRQLNPQIPVIILTSYGTIDNAVNLLRQGAWDYLTKPFQINDLLQRLDKAVETLQLKQEIETLRRELGRRGSASGEIIGNSPAIVSVLEQLPVIARSEAAVIFYGDSGTGKELFARAIHKLSNRSTKPFVTVNCGAIPETLLENELFGHVKGAYSDALTDRDGLVREANGGTLFLDEVGDIIPGVQVKLLRFLQEKEYKPLGDSVVRQANVRIIAATNKDLRTEVDKGGFREDLYYRLNIIPIILPPLRERKEDLILLAGHFLHKYASLHNSQVRSFSPLALQALVQHDWPGNVRELENKIQQLVVLAKTSVIRAEDIRFGEGSSSKAESRSFQRKSFQDAKKDMVDVFEKTYLKEVLAICEGNITRAADEAGKNRRAFFELLRKHDIDAKSFRLNRNDGSDGD